jgi:hypothetical protein
MIRGKGYKLARYEKGLRVLYDLKNDPGEVKKQGRRPGL